MKNFTLFFTDAKNFLANELNRLFVLFLLVNIILGIIIHLDIQNLRKTQIENTDFLYQEIIKTRKRVDYRYFNMTRSLENIYGIKLDTKDGDIKK